MKDKNYVGQDLDDGIFQMKRRGGGGGHWQAITKDPFFFLVEDDYDDKEEEVEDKDGVELWKSKWCWLKC